MAKMTLLEMVQSILSDLDADEVSSIDETVDADRIVNIIKNVYYEITAPRDIPELMRIIKLYGLSDNNYPNYLEIPEGVSNIQWFQYNKADFPLSGTNTYEFADVKWMEPYEFIAYTSRRDVDDTNVIQVDERISGSELLIKNDKHPTYYTTFDDKYIVCDSYDASSEDTLQEYKTRVWAKYTPPFSKVDTFEPVADSNLFPYLLAESTSRAISLLRGQVDAKVEQGARRQKVYIQNDKYAIMTEPPRPKFGR